METAERWGLGYFAPWTSRICHTQICLWQKSSIDYFEKLRYPKKLCVQMSCPLVHGKLTSLWEFSLDRRPLCPGRARQNLWRNSHASLTLAGLAHVASADG